MIRSILFLLLSFLTLSLKAQDLIPLPVKWEKKTGTFSAKNALDIVVLNPDLRSQAEYLKNILPKGNHQILSKPGSKNSIILALSKNDLLGTEGYSLSVKEKRSELRQIPQMAFSMASKPFVNSYMMGKSPKVKSWIIRASVGEVSCWT